MAQSQITTVKKTSSNLKPRFYLPKLETLNLCWDRKGKSHMLKWQHLLVKGDMAAREKRLSFRRAGSQCQGVCPQPCGNFPREEFLLSELARGGVQIDPSWRVNASVRRFCEAAHRSESATVLVLQQCSEYIPGHLLLYLLKKLAIELLFLMACFHVVVSY